MRYAPASLLGARPYRRLPAKIKLLFGTSPRGLDR